MFLLCTITIISACSNMDTDLPEGDEELSFVVIGDLQQGYGIYSKLAGNIGDLIPVPAAAINLGDIMLRAGNEVEWVNFWHYSEPITQKMPLYITRCNHEGNSDADELALRKYGKMQGKNFYYHVVHEYILFLMLDTEVRGEEGRIGNKQLEWLDSLLNSAAGDSAIQDIFIFMHRPLYPQGFHQGSDLVNADSLHARFSLNEKIRAVFSGHDHLFNVNIKEGVHYITSGAGGAPLYHGYGGDYHHFTKVSIYRSAHRINIKTIGIFNEIIEDFDI